MEFIFVVLSTTAQETQHARSCYKYNLEYDDIRSNFCLTCKDTNGRVVNKDLLDYGTTCSDNESLFDNENRLEYN